MDVMVQWDQTTDEGQAFARVSAVASAETLEARTRDVVTLYGEPTPESLALALAATVEARKAGDGAAFASGDLRLSASDGAIGASEFQDLATGELIRRELAIPLTVLKETAEEILREGGQGIRRLLAGLLMPEWPEGTRRALGYQLAAAPASRTSDTLAALREADAENFLDED
jgi:hypothetical protein